MARDYDKYKRGYNFDKNHRQFRNMAFIRFMSLREKEFINNFRFEGDERFTRAKQRAFLKAAFRYGYSGIINTANIVKDVIDKNVMEIIEYAGLNVSDMIPVEENYIPVAVTPNLFSVDERPIRGQGFTAPLHNSSKKTYEVTTDNTAIFQFDNNHLSGYYWWAMPAYIHATGKTVMKKRLTLADSKLANNKVNNSERNIAYDDIYDVDKSFVELAPAQTSIAGDKANEITIATMLDTKLQKMDINNGETINDLLDFVEKHEKSVMTEMGVRTNINDGKEERSITADFTSMEVHWRKLEQEFKDQFGMFIEDYTRVFGKTITMVSLTDEVLQESKEHEIAKAGQANNIKDGGQNDKDN